jgi:MFS family permease
MTDVSTSESRRTGSAVSLGTDSRHDAYQALRYREFSWFLAGNTAMSLATQVQSLVMGWQVYELTRDPLSLGLIGLSEAIPFLAMTLIGGWAADRRDRRTLTLFATLALGVGACLLVAMNLGAPPGSAWPYYAVQALAGLGRAFYRPASQALGTDLVPRVAFQNAATWRSSGFHLAMVVGPALGGVLYSFGSALVAYGVEAMLMAFSFFALVFLPKRPAPPRETTSLGASLSEGIRFVFSHKLIVSAISLDLFAVLFGGAIALLPAFAYDILQVGPEGLGLLRAAPAVGSILMSVILAYRPPVNHAGSTLLGCVAAFGVAWIGVACSTSLPLSLLMLVASGAFDSVSVVLRATLVQTETPSEMMGRVLAVNSFFIGSSNELGAFESGVAARLLGTVPSVVFGGCMTLVVVGVTAVKVPELRRLTRLG